MILTCQPAGRHVCGKRFEHGRGEALVLDAELPLAANGRGIQGSDFTCCIFSGLPDYLITFHCLLALMSS